MPDVQSDNSKYTFWMLVKEYTIKIPIMQRDYAQGRVTENVTAIRTELLDSIYNALINEKNMDFDFVYGTLKNGILYPLDGQQRLTTLYLLHWYIACKEETINEAREVLQNFTYETRISSREFCEKLMELDYIPEEGTLPSEYIKDQNIYFDVWDKDPTIRHMLVMLDAIHEKFYDEDKELYPLLTRELDENPIITFNYLPMENYALTDDLYIKMNARGKNLSDFENFKAKFIQHMKKNDLPYEHFEASVDKEWTDLLWDYRSPIDNTIDEQFMYLFLYFTEMIYLEYSDQKDGNSPFRVTDIRGLISFYDTEEKIEELYELFDLWQSKEEIDECFDAVFSDQYSEGKVRIFDDKHNLIEATINKNSLKVFNKVILFLFMKRLIFFKKKGENDDGIKNYVRIIRNFVVKVRQRKYENYTPDFRFCRHGIPYISFGLDEILEVDDIYGFISEMEDDRVNSESLKYEKDKADYILKNPEMEEYIHKLEDMDEFRTFIHNIMPFVKNRHIEDLADNIKELFSEQFFEKLLRAMLSVNDYGIDLGNSYFGRRYYYGNRVKDWYNILSTTDRNDYPQVITEFLNQYYDADSSDIDESLNIIIDNNLPQLDKYKDWRYYFVKYPRTVENYQWFIDADNFVVMLERPEEDEFFVPHRLNGKQLTGYHACPLYLEVSMRLCDDIDYVQRGKDADDLSSLLFRSGTKVKITPDNLVQVWYTEEGDITDQIATRADELWEVQDTEDMDYVEQLELMCQNVLKAEEEILE